MSGALLYYLKHCCQFVWNIATAWDKSWIGNIAWGETECYICHETLIKSCILSYKPSGSALSVLLYFTLKDVLTEDIPLKVNTFNE